MHQVCWLNLIFNSSYEIKKQYDKQNTEDKNGKTLNIDQLDKEYIQDINMAVTTIKKDLMVC